jgi:hypothetical protein
MISKEEAIQVGLNALTARYPNDLAFANAGFTLGVVDCIVDAVYVAQLQSSIKSPATIEELDAILNAPEDDRPIRINPDGSITAL